jgi:hypothetical protein
MIDRNLLLELKQILEEDFSLKLTLQETLEVGTNLLAYVETLLKIDSAGICKGGKQNGNCK